MLTFKEWMKIKENLWGEIPSKTKKPSDGWRSNAAPMAPKMMKKMRKK